MTDNNNTQELREALRKQREKELQKKHHKKIALAVVITLVIVSIIGGLTWIFTNNDSASNTATVGEQLTPTKVDANGAFHVTTDGVSTDLEPTGKTRVDMFFDPMCPGCGIVDRGMGEKLNQLSQDGTIDLYMTPVAFLNSASSDNYSTRAVNATITVAEEAPEYYLDFINNIYEAGNQPSEGQNYVSVTDSMLAERAIEVGVPAEVAKKFSEGHYNDWIEENTTKQLNQRDDLFPDGFSTPAVFINIAYKEDGTTVDDYTRVDFESDDIEKTFLDALETAQEK